VGETIYTIGHSNHSARRFIDLLQVLASAASRMFARHRSRAAIRSSARRR